MDVDRNPFLDPAELYWDTISDWEFDTTPGNHNPINLKLLELVILGPYW